MPKEQISQLASDNWIQKELYKLKNETLILVVVVFSAFGLLLSYYVFNDVLGLPFKNITYRKYDDNLIGIKWESKTPLKTKVEYGTSQIYLNDTDYHETFETSHSVQVKGLLPGKDHYIRLVAEDAQGQKYTTPFFVASK